MILVHADGQIAMLDTRRLLATTLLWALTAGAALAEPVAAGRGRWTGTIPEPPPGSSLRAGPVDLAIDGSAERFTVKLTGPGGEWLSGEFRAGERKDVFGAPTAKGVMALLGRGGEANPLEGKPLAWARRVGEELVVYRLDLRDGAHRLDRLALAPSGNRINVVFERREHDRPAVRVAATLERSAQ